jgi:twitching motility two-component system response regulator PilH
MFKWLHPNANRRDHDTQSDGRASRRFVQPDGGTTDRRHGGRRVNAGRRELDFIAQRSEARRVLIIAPNLETRLLYTTLFEQAGYTVYSADEDSAGIAMAQHYLPDVVVAEDSAPRATSFDTLDHLHATPLTANIPVVVVTSSVHFDMPVYVRAPATILVLARPVDPDNLINAVTELASITPPERSVRRQLTRTLLALRKCAAHMKPDVDVQQRVRALIDRLQVAVLALDEHGRYIAASPAVSELTGYTQHELLAMSIFDSQFDSDLFQRDKWPNVLEPEQGGMTAIVRVGKRRTRRMKATFLTIVPGLHAAAIAPVLDAGN